ncbi:BREX-1 system adenine-specific DNA-methyltransferase PglX [Synechococcus sp. BMK-MC-1]|uniref:BREX-1 system adenine-specific DNA-methyltransferase PglX n=1 Tax=Synechococcus sp. BMK-MC-1 TaxID=1442551 RepID=UPI001646CD0F|nr:BREX-1 system adenine-specific DNA-methyltransferase PglX [Synechococcus sp. BMK-MC-1]QNI68447.1 Putative Type IIC bifunctional restriction-modification protein with endonuclease and N6-adenine DNA methyltransferase activity [Synechococcus sp. BMK-MC-1]
MAVNTAALKTFAPAMRRQLMEAVGRKLDLLLNSQTPDTLSTYAKQIAELREEQEKSREQLLEQVAYTWFNRLCALRYLDAKGWHPFGCKVLMPADGSETQPELLKLMRSGSLPADLKTFTSEQRLNQLLDGQIPTAIPGGDAQGEVYRELVLAACRSYHQLLPDLFEGLDDASELLLPDDLLTEGSIAGNFRISISDSDCDDVEIIGWLYQFYISEKKDEVIGKVVKSEDIPAATQLFTPNWIVKYMVQNTIGAQWLATYPDSPLRQQMEFYIEPAEQTDEVKAKLAEITPTSLNPEELTLMDPACGSGHILVEAYEIFKAIYLEQGYQLREMPKLILEKNLFGLDIDPRAIQLSIFSLLMKGREDERRLLERDIKLNVIALQDSTDFNPEGLAQQINLSDYGLQLNDLTELKRLFELSTTFGSLIQVPERMKTKLPALRKLSEAVSQGLFAREMVKHLEPLLQQAVLLATQYNTVVANPPYMGGKYQPSNLKKYLNDHYVGYEKDFFAAFIDRDLSLTKKHGRLGFMTPFVWMFISSHEQLRRRLIEQETISSLVQLEYSGFEGATVPICTFTLRKGHVAGEKSCFIRLSDFRGSENQGPKTLEAVLDRNCGWFFEVAQDEFSRLPGSPAAYWLSDEFRSIYDCSRLLGTAAHSLQGMITGNNNTFLRRWHEPKFEGLAIGFDDMEDVNKSPKYWVPYNKGGDLRKWYGNNEFVLNWSNQGRDLVRSRTQNSDYYLKECVTWTFISSSFFAARHCPNGFVWDVAGSSAFPNSKREHTGILALMCSGLGKKMLDASNPTLNYQVENILALPLHKNLTSIEDRLSETVYRLVEASKKDWDAYERSWDFQSLPLLTAASSEPTSTLESSYIAWITENREVISKMKHIEEKNNRLLIDAYGLSDELNPDVPIEQITLTANPFYRYGGDSREEEKLDRFQRDSMAELLSYATGCMMGRYSLDHPGLILADSRSNQEEQLTAYEAKIGKSISEIQFKPDADAIIPVLDGEWFEDDIVARTREFLKVTFPESSVGENLRFIEESLGKDIRKYFCSEFYKDHLQTYKKRPIYWMVQSPKKGFACLIYLHRYTKDTLNQVLNNYFRPYLQKLEARQEQLERDQNNDALPKREQTAARKEAEKITKVLKECQAWEQDALMPLAQQRIELDLDDGVKVNYLKLQEVLAKIPGLAAKGD